MKKSIALRTGSLSWIDTLKIPFVDLKFNQNGRTNERNNEANKHVCKQVRPEPYVDEQNHTDEKMHDA